MVDVRIAMMGGIFALEQSGLFRIERKRHAGGRAMKKMTRLTRVEHSFVRVIYSVIEYSAIRPRTML